MSEPIAQPHAPDVTVLIPTRNRAAELDRALASLAQQDTGGACSFEVLVVDNGSTDGTRGVVERWAERTTSAVRHRYLYEPTEGQVHALNAGVREAEGAYVAFLDDDERASSRWLRTFWGCVSAEYADAVTGRMMPIWETAQPTWITARLMGTLGCPSMGTHRLALTEDWEYWWCGGNAIVRRAMIHRVGGFNPQMPRGHDTDLAYRLAQAGARMFYEPEAVAYHRIPRERLTPAYLRHWHVETGRCWAYRFPWKPHHRLTVMPLWWYRQQARFAVRFLKDGLSRNPSDRLWYRLRLLYAMATWQERWRQLWAGEAVAK